MMPARPPVENIAAVRVPRDRLIKLHVATWHAGPHFVHDECLFINLENQDTIGSTSNSLNAHTKASTRSGE